MNWSRLSFRDLEAIAAGRRLPTFAEVRALARELLSLRDSRTLLSSALDVAEADLELAHEAAESYRSREQLWRRHLDPETWTMLERLARLQAPSERVDTGEA